MQLKAVQDCVTSKCTRLEIVFKIISSCNLNYAKESMKNEHLKFVGATKLNFIPKIYVFCSDYKEKIYLWHAIDFAYSCIYSKAVTMTYGHRLKKRIWNKKIRMCMLM